MTDDFRPALVLIDLQRDLCYDDRRRHLFDTAIDDIRRLIAGFREHARPIVFTRFELEADDPQFARFGDTYCVRDTPGAGFVDEIDPSVGIVVAKVKHSAFFGTNLEAILRDAGCTSIVLGGLQTQICILTTAADAYNRDLRVIAAAQAVISTRDDVRLEALEWISKYVGEVADIDSILAML